MMGYSKYVLFSEAKEEPEQKVAKLDEPVLSIEERLNDAVTPSWRVPYERQLVVNLIRESRENPITKL